MEYFTVEYQYYHKQLGKSDTIFKKPLWGTGDLWNQTRLEGPNLREKRTAER